MGSSDFERVLANFEMDESPSGSNSLPPFLVKTYEMVDAASTDPVVSWSQGSKSFVVWNPPEFARDLLPKYFKHNNFSSFIRQLNTYGFRKIDPERWEFANDDFVRGQPQLLKNIHRRKPVHSHSLQNLQNQGSSSPLTDAERQGLKEEVERLKGDKESLQLELQVHEEERKGFEVQMQNLKARLLKMEDRQKNMVSNLGNVLQKPGLALNMLIESEFNDKKRRLPRIGYYHDEGHGEDNHAGTPQTLTRENIDGASSLPSILDLYEQLESSLTIWEYIAHDCENIGQRNSTLDFDETTSCADSPAISCIQFNIDARPRSPTIDMNSEPTAATVFEPAVVTTSEPALTIASEPALTVASEPVSSKEQAVATAPNVPAGVNDVFWEQFLTENPGSSDVQEVQSERKDTDGRRNESKPADHSRFWWNAKTVNNLTGQLGHLTPAEST